MFFHCIFMCGTSLDDSDQIFFIAISAPYSSCTGSSQLLEFKWVMFTVVECNFFVEDIPLCCGLKYNDKIYMQPTHSNTNTNTTMLFIVVYILSLYFGSSERLYCTSFNSKMTMTDKLEGMVKKCQWTILGHHFIICLEGQKKAIQNLRIASLLAAI